MAKILCVEDDVALRESRCAVLRYSSYDATSASPRQAEGVLRGQQFDLVVTSSPDERDLHRIASLSVGAEVLVLDGITMPCELLVLVEQRTNRHRRA